ncbi:hypothetical protein COW36_02140 [bacterium (Candidatus Blackallbacteria) CG17_big_fil_post_rev_8_21_14_2_50_48_46]|uniref:Uncharacterized protein n=1 Tax=bacterium (Candidatus Blackallbacteria) CG17_big_fil_post_rev_8_21_14_2_50_48_46 TaxID=2014261 RepID=A0A2M7GAQ2_9BACT|nr:MAG: hypothetical protein COW64_26530 [bacterium (Candidatus Blackallbacteria) CG18_big_fil_WC_8_21_14_2_50_49_26]PIW19233.1 MAG: hypothetical protein COW36_02140 [bacterium (Candidatus Blackallbacteria) CG17_big_fil_post_rev_8_21_14_2_50_48_46]PIW45417.1 MAG: hypothetical protein COW20_20000 [bacterium (Candidatus Blackallbacteria) CG13_big_fil_rev_8_21_14_2_50_49_14]
MAQEQNESQLIEEEEDLDEALGEDSDVSYTLLTDGHEEYESADEELDGGEDDDYYDADDSYDGDFDEGGGDSGF